MAAAATLTPESFRRYLKREARVWGAQVRARRKALGLTLEQLAELSFTTPQTVFKVERGEIVARDHLRLAIAFALCVEVDELFPAPRRADVVNDVA